MHITLKYNQSLRPPYLDAHGNAVPDSKVHGASMGPPGSCWPQMGPMLAPWTLLSGVWKLTYIPPLPEYAWYDKKNTQRGFVHSVIETYHNVMPNWFDRPISCNSEQTTVCKWIIHAILQVVALYLIIIIHYVPYHRHTALLLLVSFDYTLISCRIRTYPYFSGLLHSDRDSSMMTPEAIELWRVWVKLADRDTQLTTTKYKNALSVCILFWVYDAQSIL